MRSLAQLGVLAALAAALAGSASASDRDRPISEMVSDLQRVQAQMAVGDKAAYAVAQERLHAIAAAIAAAKPEEWKDKAQTDAVAIYILSGGQPREVARLLERGDVPEGEDKLVRGALAYASGREREAESLLGDIDPKKVSLRLAGQLAYAQSVLLTSRDPKRAVELLDLARLISPGSLIEEATLRREILMVSDRRDGDRVVFLSRQYVTRFGHSIYAENFIQGLASSAVRFGLSDDIEGFKKFESLLGLVTPEQRRIFLLTVARAQILNGRIQVANVAAREAIADAPAGSVDEMRARLFLGAAEYVGQEYDSGVAMLASVDRSKLAKPDQDLHSAISFAAAHLHDQPSPTALAEAGREDQVAAARSPAAADSKNADSVSQTIKRAESLLDVAEGVGREETP